MIERYLAEDFEIPEQERFRPLNWEALIELAEEAEKSLEEVPEVFKDHLARARRRELSDEEVGRFFFALRVYRESLRIGRAVQWEGKRVVCVHIPCLAIEEVLKSDEIHARALRQLPTDAKIVATSYDLYRQAVFCVFESEEFEVVEEGQLPPNLDPRFERANDSDSARELLRLVDYLELAFSGELGDGSGNLVDGSNSTA